MGRLGRLGREGCWACVVCVLCVLGVSCGVCALFVFVLCRWLDEGCRWWCVLAGCPAGGRRGFRGVHWLSPVVVVRVARCGGSVECGRSVECGGSVEVRCRGNSLAPVGAHPPVRGGGSSGVGGLAGTRHLVSPAHSPHPRTHPPPPPPKGERGRGRGKPRPGSLRTAGLRGPPGCAPVPPGTLRTDRGRDGVAVGTSCEDEGTSDRGRQPARTTRHGEPGGRDGPG